MTYYYPIVSGGYRWNLLKRCLWEVGIEPLSVGDVEEQTFVQFSRELNQLEKDKLDMLMNDNPQFPKSGDAVVFTIGDIWEIFDEFKEKAQFPDLKLYYSESIPGSGNVNQIEIHHPTALSEADKEKIKNAYTNLFK